MLSTYGKKLLTIRPTICYLNSCKRAFFLTLIIRLKVHFLTHILAKILWVFRLELQVFGYHSKPEVSNTEVYHIIPICSKHINYKTFQISSFLSPFFKSLLSLLFRAVDEKNLYLINQEIYVDVSPPCHRCINRMR